jgi:hypothetical protein
MQPAGVREYKLGLLPPSHTLLYSQALAAYSGRRRGMKRRCRNSSLKVFQTVTIPAKDYKIISYSYLINPTHPFLFLNGTMSKRKNIRHMNYCIQ